jgi:hypothetical protein
MTIYTAYDQLADLIATIDAAKIMNLKATPEMQSRMEYLIEKSKESSLSKVEKDELDHFIVLERLIRLAKIRAFHTDAIA